MQRKRSSVFEYYPLEEQFIGLKMDICDIIGITVDDRGFLIDQNDGNLITMKKKPINIGLEMDMYINIFPFSIMNGNLFDRLFHIYLSNLYENDPLMYAQNYSESCTTKSDCAVQLTSMRIYIGGIDYFTKMYYIPGLKYISLIYILEGELEEGNLSKFDSSKFVLDYNERAAKYNEWLYTPYKKRKMYYDFKH